MTGSRPDTRDEETRPISVAELLAKNGTIGSPPVTGRRRRRGRGNADAVTVAELTGEIPVVRVEDTAADEHAGDDEHRDHQRHEEPARDERDTGAQRALGDRGTEPAPNQPDDPRPATAPQPAERPERIWPKSSPALPTGFPGPARGYDPRPIRRSTADSMVDSAFDSTALPSLDPHDDYLDEHDDYPDAYVEPRDDDYDYSDSGFQGFPGFGGFTGFDPDATEDDVFDAPRFGAVEETHTHDERDDDEYRSDDDSGGPFSRERFFRRRKRDTDLDDDPIDDAHEHDDERDDDEYVDEPVAPSGRRAALLGNVAIVLESLLALAFGAGVCTAFGQLWRWNNVVALVLTMLVTIGMAVAVRVVRKTEDIVTTLAAVAAGLIITLGPLVFFHAT